MLQNHHFLKSSYPLETLTLSLLTLVISQCRFLSPLLVSPPQINSVESNVLGLRSFPVICSSFCPSVILPSARVLNSRLYLELWSHLENGIHNSQFSKYNGLDSITDSMDMKLSKVLEIAKDREAHGAAKVIKSWTQLSDWTTVSLNLHILSKSYFSTNTCPFLRLPLLI